MMEPYERIAQAFHKRIDSIAGAVDAMAPGIESASQLILQAALQDRKVLVFACAPDGALSHYLVELLRAPSDARPSLPAIPVGGQESAGEDSPSWHHLRTLSRDGDVVICLDTVSGAPIAQRCAQIAAQRNLVAISMSEVFEQAAGAVCIDLRAEDRALRSELMLMACHCLQDQLGQQMLGS